MPARLETAFGIRHMSHARILALGGPDIPDGSWLMYCDVEGLGGRGDIRWTDHPSRALRFATKIDALSLFHRQSTFMPLRPDGKPNKPLTAYTINIEVIPPWW